MRRGECSMRIFKESYLYCYVTRGRARKNKPTQLHLPAIFFFQLLSDVKAKLKLDTPWHSTKTITTLPHP